MGYNIVNIFLVGVLSFMQPLISSPLIKKEITVEIRVFRIPAFQSFPGSSAKHEGGGAIGSRFGGNVTASFPEGITVLRTASNKNNNELIQLIKDKISSYPCGCGDLIGISPHASHSVALNHLSLSQNMYELHNMIHGRRSWVGEYWFSIQLLDVESRKILTNFIGDAIYYSSLRFTNSGRIAPEVLFNQTIEICLDETLLVGFAPPKAEDGFRGTAYWFAFTVIDH
ncbi:MAG: hypothetical protein MUP98_00025 [Candidatus Aminicenantes bacterium]|nr:hypothetical protein [Candidatus Aminicenantes bacterium]